MLFNFKFKPFTVVLLLLATCTFAQTGIGTTTPNASAKLDVYSTNKGFLPPRVTLTSVTDAATIPSPATGLLVYNTGTNVNLAAGYYYWNGSNWATIATASSPNQTVDYVSVTRTTLQTVSVGDNILFNQVNGGTIPYNSTTGLFTLTAGKTYRLTGCIAISSSNASAEEVNVVWKNANGDLLPNKGEILSTNFGTTGFANGISDVIYTPSANTTVSLTVAYSSGSVVLWGNFTYANIQQVGSSAFVNPWVLSGNNVYNTTGNVGIGTNSPDASAILDLSSTTQGLLIPRMTATQRAAISSPTTGLTVFQTDANAGNYIYNGSSWQVLSNANYGDVKTGFQSNDHNGWIKLNGRLKSTLTASQQTQANLLGIGTNLPNADNSVLMQSSSGTFGIVNGSNSKTITQANLPSYNLPAATSSSNGDHTHWISAATIDNRDFDGTPNNFQQFGLVSDAGSYSINDANRSIGRNTLNAGTHNHNVTVSSGGSGTALDVTPQYLKINTFIYLGF